MRETHRESKLFVCFRLWVIVRIFAANTVVSRFRFLVNYRKVEIILVVRSLYEKSLAGTCVLRR